MDPLAGRSPSTWFALLEIALRQGDRTGAARARRRLRRLGVTVTFAGEGDHAPHGRRGGRRPGLDADTARGGRGRP